MPDNLASLREPPPPKPTIATRAHPIPTLTHQEPAECRTYDYMGEAACDARMMTFLACVRAVRDQTPGGFAAVKLTALGDPVLLSQLTTCVHVRVKSFVFGFCQLLPNSCPCGFHE